MHKESHPSASKFILRSTYVDDAIDSVSESTEKELIKETEEMVGKGGFLFKEWRVSRRMNEKKEQQLKGENGITGVLGVSWKHMEDVITFTASLNFSPKKRGARSEPDLKRFELPERLPDWLTRRIVLQQTMTIFDPMGLLSPFTIIAKQLLRDTWKLKLKWDEKLPSYMLKKWQEFFTDMYEMFSYKY